MEVQGKIGIGEGWWITLREVFDGIVNAENRIVLSRPNYTIIPNIYGFDPETAETTSLSIVAGVVEDSIDEVVSGTLNDLGDIQGDGWIGHAYSSAVDEKSGEFEVLGLLAGENTVLNIAVRYFGLESRNDALQIIVDDIVHEPASTKPMNDQIQAQMRAFKDLEDF